MQFKIGDRIGKGNVPFEEYQKVELGTIIDIDHDGNLSIKWDYDSSICRITAPYNLLSEEEARQRWSLLEIEWTQLNKAIEEKLTAAGKLVDEAKDLAKNNGQDLFHMWDAVQPLMTSLRNVGWSTSSLRC